MAKRVRLEVFHDEDEIEHLKRLAAAWNTADAEDGRPGGSTWRSAAEALAVIGLRQRLENYSQHKPEKSCQPKNASQSTATEVSHAIANMGTMDCAAQKANAVLAVH